MALFLLSGWAPERAAIFQVAGFAQPPPVVQGKRLPAPTAEADVVSQPVEQNFVDIIRRLLPAVIQLVLVHRAFKGSGKGKV